MATVVVPREGGSRTWILGILTGIAVVVVGLTVFALIRSSRAAPEAKPAAASAQSIAALERPPIGSGVQLNPAFKDLELTGFRLTEDAKQRPQLQFVVVNHSGADLGEIKARVNLRAANLKAEDPPVGTVAFAVSLGPYEAKDLKAPIDTKLRVYELPDWQLLRPEIAGR